MIATLYALAGTLYLAAAAVAVVLIRNHPEVRPGWIVGGTLFGLSGIMMLAAAGMRMWL